MAIEKVFIYNNTSIVQDEVSTFIMFIIAVNLYLMVFSYALDSFVNV